MGTSGCDFKRRPRMPPPFVQKIILWRPASEWDNVVPSTISSSPPTGTPWAIRLASTPASAHSSAI
ncbi:Uncharacterised protein [Salmonella enterica subsp. enterica]|nr:Uncharacterised protein [Salmonella enterica subsp. enterica] [Salmonella enterica subsp. enterica serovar Menston]